MDTDALDRISYLTIQAAIEIHKALGPGLLESVYRTCMIYELRARNLAVSSELIVPVRYKELVMDRINSWGCSSISMSRDSSWVWTVSSTSSGGPPR